MSKKQAIEKTAARLFAAQGFDATTTVQIACEAWATEPMIYCHFKGKDELFAGILQNAFAGDFCRPDQLSQDDGNHFKDPQANPRAYRFCRRPASGNLADHQRLSGQVRGYRGLVYNEDCPGTRAAGMPFGQCFKDGINCVFLRASMCPVSTPLPRAEGHTIAKAVQIKPWSQSCDDAPLNRLVRRRLCHRSFDEGLMSIGKKLNFWHQSG